jgi:uncharacterized protein (TIGR02598 family)
MHAPPAAPAFATSANPRSNGAFSLVEVTLALGIVAFAFVALFGLLPVGMTVFRQSIDSANETWIMQDFNSMVQVTDWKRVKDLSHEKSREVYYFDEEGRRTDTENHQVANRAADRIYAAKLLVEEIERPGGGPSAGDVNMAHGYKVIAVLAPYLNPPAMRDFATVVSGDSILNLPKGSVVRTRSFVVARMDSEKD